MRKRDRDRAERIRLAEKYYVIAPDMCGVGDSERPMGGYDKRTMAEDIWQLVQHLGRKKAMVIGHDFGGAVAYALAAEHRDFVSKLVIVEMAPGSIAHWRKRVLRRAPRGLSLRNDRTAPGTASRSLILLLATACGLIAANVY